jgi:hypothetical protein
MSWRKVLAIVLSGYLLANIIFAIVYVSLGLGPNVLTAKAAIPILIALWMRSFFGTNHINSWLRTYQSARDGCQ